MNKKNKKIVLIIIFLSIILSSPLGYGIDRMMEGNISSIYLSFINESGENLLINSKIPGVNKDGMFLIGNSYIESNGIESSLELKIDELLDTFKEQDEVFKDKEVYKIELNKEKIELSENIKINLLGENEIELKLYLREENLEEPEIPEEPEEPEPEVPGDGGGGGSGGGGVEPEVPEEPEEPKEPETPTTPGGRPPGNVIGPEGELVDPPDELVELELNRMDHFKYIEGYPDGNIKPNNNITREEISAMGYRLLDEDYREFHSIDIHKYTDIELNRWSEKYIATLSDIKILEGYEGNIFKPKQNLTRAELSTIIYRMNVMYIDEIEEGENTFPDVKGHWAEFYISSIYKSGWIEGYKDGEFKPDREITRAETVTMINNMLNRKTKIENMLPERKEYPDLKKEHWYYEAMQEASNSHEYIIDEDEEKWLKILN